MMYDNGANLELSPEDKSYLRGIFDSGGCIAENMGFRDKAYYKPVIKIGACGEGQKRIWKFFEGFSQEFGLVSYENKQPTGTSVSLIFQLESAAKLARILSANGIREDECKSIVFNWAKWLNTLEARKTWRKNGKKGNCPNMEV